MVMRIVMIGAGNLATHLATALQERGHHIVTVYSHTEASARRLGERLNVPYTTQLDTIDPTAQLYLFAIKDSALEEVVQAMPHTSGVWAHTAGSMSMELFAPYHKRYGVFYPLQTFSRERQVSFAQLPLFVEGCNSEVKGELQRVAESLSQQVHEASSEQRKYLHLAAVFACNFTNHMYHLSAQLLASHALPPDALLPLIDETAAKVHYLTPREAQTGPAVRYDTNVMALHLELLPSDALKEIYQIVSESIHKDSI